MDKAKKKLLMLTPVVVLIMLLAFAVYKAIQLWPALY